MFCGMNTDARLLALRYYRDMGRDISADIEALAANPRAVVVWLPRLVVLMKAADSRHPEQWQELGSSPAVPDGWYVHLLAGDLSLARRLACEVPSLPQVCFQRGKRSAAPHRLDWQRVLRRRHV